MDLYLVRHAIAEPRSAARWPDDSRRPLSTEGVELFRRAALGLRRLGIGVDAVLTSSYPRAAQTAAILTEYAEWPEAETCRALEPPASVRAAGEVLGARAEASLAIVGHQPELSGLASVLLTSSETAVDLELKKGGVVCLRFAGRAESGGALLRWSATPQILRQLGA